MTDIVKQLRSVLGLYCLPPAPYSSTEVLDMMHEAADEIEQLRAALLALIDDETNGELAKARAAKERLKVSRR